MAISTQSGRRISICKFTPGPSVPLPGHSWSCWVVGSQLGTHPAPVEGGGGLLGLLGMLVLCHGGFGSQRRGLRWGCLGTVQSPAEPTGEGGCPHVRSLPQFLPGVGMVPLV